MIMANESLERKTIRNLIGRRTEISDALFKAQNLKEPEEEGKRGSMAVLSVLSSRDEFWEIGLSAIGYIAENQMLPTELPEVLEQISQTPEKPLPSQLEVYLGDVLTLSLDSASTAATTVLRALRLEELAEDEISCIGWCLEHHSGDGLMRCVLKCMR
jgi:hypothetical protein